ncbi:unnamed protein product, partial [Prorocentrum cordatum]
MNGVARRLGPTALVLELDEERLLPYLCCPREHLVSSASVTGVGYRASKSLQDRHSSREYASFGDVVEGVDEGDGWVRVAWDPESFGLLDQFELDQMWVLARREGAEVHEALEAVCERCPPDELLPSWLDPARDLHLADACIAAVALGHRLVLLVAGESHVDPVAAELLRRSRSAGGPVTGAADRSPRRLAAAGPRTARFSFAGRGWTRCWRGGSSCEAWPRRRRSGAPCGTSWLAWRATRPPLPARAAEARPRCAASRSPRACRTRRRGPAARQPPSWR